MLCRTWHKEKRKEGNAVVCFYKLKNGARGEGNKRNKKKKVEKDSNGKGKRMEGIIHCSFLLEMGRRETCRPIFFWSTSLWSRGHTNTKIFIR